MPTHSGFIGMHTVGSTLPGGMEYQTGSIGRVFVIRFDDGENFIEEFTALLKKENIKSI